MGTILNPDLVSFIVSSELFFDVFGIVDAFDVDKTVFDGIGTLHGVLYYLMLYHFLNHFLVDIMF